MMKFLFVVFAAMVLLSALPSQSQAHSLEWVENNIGKKGKFFKPVHKKAPTFELRDSKGNTVRGKSFPDKNIILFFVDDQCVDACLTQIRRMAQFQSMLNITPMREGVQFVAVVTDEAQVTGEVNVDPVNWVYLVGGKNLVGQLKKDFGHTATIPDSAVVHVIGSKGQWRADFRGVKFKLVNFLVYMNALQNSIRGIKDGHGL